MNKIIILDTYQNKDNGKVEQRTTTISRDMVHKYTRVDEYSRLDYFNDDNQLVKEREVVRVMYKLNIATLRSPSEFLEKIGVELLIELKRELDND